MPSRILAVMLISLFLINVIAMVPIPCTASASRHGCSGATVTGEGHAVDGSSNREGDYCPMRERSSCKAGRVSCRGCFLLVFNNCTHDTGPAQKYTISLVVDMHYIHSSFMLTSPFWGTMLVPAEITFQNDFHPYIDERPPAYPA